MKIPNSIKNTFHMSDVESDWLADKIWYWSRSTPYNASIILDLIQSKLNKGLPVFRILNSKSPEDLLYTQTPLDFSRIYKK